MKYNFKEIINKIYPYVFTFFTCAFLGWVIETSVISLQAGAFRDRGLPLGPICPIYGFGGLFLYIFFKNPKKDIKNIIFNFLKATIVLGTFELLSGLFLKYVFNIEFWNYEGISLNIFNYVTVKSAISWGILSLLYIYFLQPLILKWSQKVPVKYRSYIVISVITIFIIDLVFSTIRAINIPEAFNTMVKPFE